MANSIQLALTGAFAALAMGTVAEAQVPPGSFTGDAPSSRRSYEDGRDAVDRQNEARYERRPQIDACSMTENGFVGNRAAEALSRRVGPDVRGAARILGLDFGLRARQNCYAERSGDADYVNGRRDRHEEEMRNRRANAAAAQALGLSGNAGPINPFRR